MERLKGLEPSTFSLGSEKTRTQRALMGASLGAVGPVANRSRLSQLDTVVDQAGRAGEIDVAGPQNRLSS